MGARSLSAFAAALLVAACGGSSKIDDGSAGTAGQTAGSTSAGGSGHGGTSGTGGKSGSTGNGGTGGGTTPASGGGGDVAGTTGDAGGAGGSGAVGGDTGAVGGGAFGGTGAIGGSFGTGAVGGDFGTGAIGGGLTCGQENCVCGPGGCTVGDPNVTPVEPPGPVLCGGVPCADGESCCLATGTCFDPSTDAGACATPPADADPTGRKACASNAQCDAGWFCSLESGLCQGTGHCQPMSNCGTCDDGGSGACRVCGCDGNTYPNPQTACRAGTVAIYPGAACGETITNGSGGAGGSGGSAGSAGSGADPITPCGTSSDCQRGDACCAITGRCYPITDQAQCALPPPGTRFPCTSNAQCYDWELCQGDACDGPGGCVGRGGNGDCGVILDPVCGCDGVSYTSADCAGQRGVRVASKGACAE